MLTKEILLASKEYKDWVKKEPFLIHNVYYDSSENYAVFIVIILNKNDKFDIIRFFEGGNKIQVSCDYQNLSIEETFKKLLSDYSRGLE